MEKATSQSNVEPGDTVLITAGNLKGKIVGFGEFLDKNVPIKAYLVKPQANVKSCDGGVIFTVIALERHHFLVLKGEG